MLRRGVLRRQAGDEISDLDACFALDQTSPLDARDLRRAQPLQMLDGFARDGDLARPDAAVTVFKGPCTRKIGRRAVTRGKRRQR